MKRKKITGIIAAILSASVLMSACASDKKPRRDRDDDDDATPGFTRNTTEETEPLETGAAPGSSLGATWDPEEVYEDEFLYNYDEIADEAFADYVNDYIVRSETAIFVSPWYSEDGDNGAWGDALLNLPCEAETYMDAVIELNV